MMMKQLIKAIYTQPPSTLEKQDEHVYQALMTNRFFHQYASQLYYLMKQHGLLEQTPISFRQALKQQATENMLLSCLIHQETVNVLQLFEANHVPVIPLKGVVFAEKYFGSAAARRTSDIDILVHPEDEIRAIQLVAKLGFTVLVPYEREHFHKAFQKQFTDSAFTLTIEIHQNFQRRGISSLAVSDLWRHTQPLDTYRYVHELSPQLMFYIICLHGWNHELISWKYFIDIIQMIHILGDQLHYDQLLAFAKKEKTQHRIARTLSIVYHEFPFLNECHPLPLPIRSSYWWKERALEDDHHLKATLPILIKHLRQVNDYDTWLQKCIYLIRLLSPDPVIMDRLIGENKRSWPRPLQYMLFLGESSKEIVSSMLPRKKHAEK
ncbi:MAG: nucleotidyltransferase family protein [Sporolactobacillus sp.]